VREPEDHAAALCEAMQVIVAEGDEYDFSQQREFFRLYILPWMGRFFGDLQQTRSARFYRAVGQLGEQFVDIEQEYLSMVE
jgi:TorA maturation chaperone TorD